MKQNVEQVKGHVTSKLGENPEVSEEVDVIETEVHDNPAVVQINMGATKNLGNYESFRVSVSLSMPCDPDMDSVNRMAENVYGWVDDKLEEILKEIEV